MSLPGYSRARMARNSGGLGTGLAVGIGVGVDVSVGVSVGAGEAVDVSGAAVEGIDGGWPDPHAEIKMENRNTIELMVNTLFIFCPIFSMNKQYNRASQVYRSKRA